MFLGFQFLRFIVFSWFICQTRFHKQEGSLGELSQSDLTRLDQLAKHWQFKPKGSWFKSWPEHWSWPHSAKLQNKDTFSLFASLAIICAKFFRFVTSTAHIFGQLYVHRSHLKKLMYKKEVSFADTNFRKHFRTVIMVY